MLTLSVISESLWGVMYFGSIVCVKKFYNFVLKIQIFTVEITVTRKFQKKTKKNNCRSNSKFLISNPDFILTYSISGLKTIRKNLVNPK